MRGDVHVYRDEDPLGRWEWFSYLSFDGHILAHFGGFSTEELAFQAASGYKP